MKLIFFFFHLLNPSTFVIEKQKKMKMKKENTAKEFSNVKMEMLVDWMKYWDKFDIESKQATLQRAEACLVNIEHL